MTSTIAQLRNELQTIAHWMVPVISTASANGTTAYLEDTTRFTDTSGLGYTAHSFDNFWLYRPSAAAAGDRERQLKGNSGSPVDLTNGRLYGGRAWTNAPSSGDRYELWHPDLRPQEAFNQLVVTMTQFVQSDYGPLGRFTDSDVQTSGTSNYSLSGAGALSKDTTAANVLFGAQSLRFAAGTAGEYLETPTIVVVPDATYFASVNLRVDVGGPFIFAIWDKTNNAEIENSNRVSHSLERFMHMPRTFVVPSTCEEISLRVYCTGSSDDAYIGGFAGPWKANDYVINAPSDLEREPDWRKLYVAQYTHPLSGDAGTVYDAFARRLTQPYQRNLDYHIRLSPHHANPGQIEFTGARLPMLELWGERLRRANDLSAFAFTASGESSPTTNLDRRLIALDWAVRLAQLALSMHPENTEAQATYSQYMRENPRTRKMEPAGEYADLLKIYARGLETPTQIQPHPAPNLGGP